MNEHKRLGGKFFIAMWLGLFLLLFLFFNDFLQKEYNPNQNIVSQTSAENTEVTLKRNRYGHYVSNGKINGETVTFILDTGATDISIPENIAQKLKLKHGRKQVYQTANGRITGFQTRLQEVSIGNIQLHNIRASINPYMKDDEILLGMSFLKHIEFTQRGDTLILRQ